MVGKHLKILVRNPLDMFNLPSQSFPPVEGSLHQVYLLAPFHQLGLECAGVDGVANHLDDLNALGDEDPDGGEGHDDVAAHLELGFDRTFPPFPLEVGHQVLQFPFRLRFVANLDDKDKT